MTVFSTSSQPRITARVSPPSTYHRPSIPNSPDRPIVCRTLATTSGRQATPITTRRSQSRDRLGGGTFWLSMVDESGRPGGPRPSGEGQRSVYDLRQMPGAQPGQRDHRRHGQVGAAEQQGRSGEDAAGHRDRPHPAGRQQPDRGQGADEHDRGQAGGGG